MTDVEMVQLIGENAGYELAVRAMELSDKVRRAGKDADSEEFLKKALGPVLSEVFDDVLSPYADLITSQALMDAFTEASTSTFNLTFSRLARTGISPMITAKAKSP